MTKRAIDADVIIPCRDDYSLLKCALDSLERQTVKFNKCYVIDDWSIIPLRREMFESYKNFSLEIHQNSASGLASARNTGISLSKSDLVAFLDADDYWEPQKLEIQTAKLEECIEAVAVVTGCFIRESSGKKIRVLTPKIALGTLGDILDGHFLISGSASSVLLRRSILETIGYFDARLDYAEDMDLWLRLARVGNFAGINDPLTNIVQRTNSIQRLGRSSDQSIREYNAKKFILREYSDYPKPVTKQLISSASKVAFYNLGYPKILRELYLELSSNPILRSNQKIKFLSVWYFIFGLIKFALQQSKSFFVYHRL